MNCENINSNYVVKSNSLVEARYRLSLQEMHVIFWLLTQIKPEDEDFKIHKLEITEFAKIIGVKPESQYKELRKVTKRLIQRAMEIYQPDTQEYLQFSWLSSARYQIKQGCVLLEFSSLLKPYLLQLKGCFTKIDIVDTLKLKSIHAVRIFELLLQYVSTGKREININDLRAYCGIEKKQYKFYADLKRYIIEKAKLEINTKTEYEVNYTEIKESCKVIAIKWSIQKKDTQTEEQLKRLAIAQKELRSEAILVESLSEYGFSKLIAKRLIKNHGEEVVRNALRAVDLQIQRNHAKNPKAMLQIAIQEKWQPEVFKRKKKLK
jgi:plasmid replication initiation protein